MTWSDQRRSERAALEHEDEATVGPQGNALIFELQRLQQALDHERDEHPPAWVDEAEARGAASPSRAPRKAAKRRNRGFDGALGLCLDALGFGRRPHAKKREPARREEPRMRRASRPEPMPRVMPAPSIAPGRAPPPVMPSGSSAALAALARLAEASRRDWPDREPRPVAGGRAEVVEGEFARRASDPIARGATNMVQAGIGNLRSGYAFLLGDSEARTIQDVPGIELSTRVRRAFDGELRTGLRVLLLSAGILGGFATLVPLSGAVVVPGNLVVEANVKKIQHPTGGVIARIAVRDGMHVNTGDLLLRLDATQARSNHQVLSKQLDQLRVRMARLLAERDGLDRPAPPAEIAGRLGEAEIRQLWESETALFASRAEARRSAKALLKSHVAQLNEQIAGLDAQAKSRTSQRDLIAGELEGVESLFQKGLVPLTRKTSLQREAARLDGELGQVTSSIAEAKSKISEAELQIVRVDQDFRTEVMKDLREAQDKEAELVEKSVAAQDLLNRVDVRAPNAGTVHELSVHTVGGVIAPGEVVMEIVPESSELQIETRLPPQDIDQVRRGQKTYVRFTAFNQRTTPQLEGQVAYVSADLSHDKQSSAAYYTVRVTLPEEERRRLGSLQLVSGMPAEVFLQTGSRTLMTYLLKPISDQLQRTFSER